jgi:hypothetical protein
MIVCMNHNEIVIAVHDALHGNEASVRVGERLDEIAIGHVRVRAVAHKGAKNGYYTRGCNVQISGLAREIWSLGGAEAEENRGPFTFRFLAVPHGLRLRLSRMAARLSWNATWIFDVSHRQCWGGVVGGRYIPPLKCAPRSDVGLAELLEDQPDERLIHIGAM